MKEPESGAGITTEQQAYDGNSLWANHCDACRKARACSDGFYPAEEFRTWINSQFSIVKPSQEIPNDNEERRSFGAFILDYAGLGLHQYVGEEVKLCTVSGFRLHQPLQDMTDWQ